MTGVQTCALPIFPDGSNWGEHCTKRAKDSSYNINRYICPTTGHDSNSDQQSAGSGQIDANAGSQFDTPNPDLGGPSSEESNGISTNG